MAKKFLTDVDMERLEGVYSDYRSLYEKPADARPMVIINVPTNNCPTWDEQLADPLVMLRAHLERIRTHIEIGDDCAPVVRVDFGTGQVASAFGCELQMMKNDLPAVKSSVLKDAKDAYDLSIPELTAGWYGKLARWTQIWIENLPEGVHIQHPDIQSPFNTANLIRGNDILTDFYDDPESVEHLLDIVTDYMIRLVPSLKAKISNDKEWFFDWSAMWKGTARISNCSATMISPDFYKKYVFPRDERFFNSVGGGRIHYCGNSRDIIDAFFSLTGLTGLDCDCQYHDLWELSEQCPTRVTLIFQQYGSAFPFTERLLRGDWPRKRNIIVITQASSVEEGKKLYLDLKRSIPKE